MEDFTSNPNATATGMAVVESTLLTAGIAAASRAANLAKGGGPKYKKAPDAPKRFKSAFIIFSAEKHKEIKDDLIQQGRTEKVSIWHCCCLWYAFIRSFLILLVQ